MIYLIGERHQRISSLRSEHGSLRRSPSKERVRDILGDDAHQLGVDQTEHRLGLAVSDPAFGKRGAAGGA
jgi:hypothetical protein